MEGPKVSVIPEKLCTLHGAWKFNFCAYLTSLYSLSINFPKQ